MKTLIALILSFAAIITQAQTTVRIPLFIEIPVQTNSTTVINITTNIFITTNEAATAFQTLPTDAIDAKLGKRLVRFMAGPSNFFPTNFGPDSFTTLFIINPGKFPITFSTNIVFLSSPPTNQPRAAVLIEKLSGEYWGTP